MEQRSESSHKVPQRPQATEVEWEGHAEKTGWSRSPRCKEGGGPRQVSGVRTSW